MSLHDSTLARAAVAWQQGLSTGLEFVAVLLRSVVFCQSTAALELVAWGEPGCGLIGVFSDVAELALACGAVPWLSTTGADLLSRWPEGYAIGIDVGSDHGMQLDARWVRGIASLVPA